MEEIIRRYRDIREDYRYNADVMDEDEEEVRRLKYIVNERLGEVDRTIMILYADLQSYRKLGSRLGISHTIVQREVRRIRRRIRDEYMRLYGKEEYGHLFGDDTGVGDGGIRR